MSYCVSFPVYLCYKEDVDEAILNQVAQESLQGDNLQGQSDGGNLQGQSDGKPEMLCTAS